MAFKIGSSLYTNQGGSSTVITNTGEAKGNQSGKRGNIYARLDPTYGYIVSLDLSSGNYFDFNPNYSDFGAASQLMFDFGSSAGDYFSNNPPLHFEFYLFWHNYKDVWATDQNFNYFYVGGDNWRQIVYFKDGVDRLNNSNSGLLDGFTQVFKFTSTEPPGTTLPAKPYYGSLYMRNCR